MGEMAEIVLDSLNHPRQHHPRQCNTKYQRHPDQDPIKPSCPSMDSAPTGH